MKKSITSELRQFFQEKAFIQLGRNCQHFYQVKNIPITVLFSILLMSHQNVFAFWWSVFSKIKFFIFQNCSEFNCNYRQDNIIQSKDMIKHCSSHSQSCTVTHTCGHYSVLLVEETSVTGEIHRPVAINWQTLSCNVVSRTLRNEQGSNSQL